MKEKMVVKASRLMEEMAAKMAGSSKCAVFWGEVELPSALRKEVERQKQSPAE